MKKILFTLFITLGFTVFTSPEQGSKELKSKLSLNDDQNKEVSLLGISEVKEAAQLFKAGREELKTQDSLFSGIKASKLSDKEMRETEGGVIFIAVLGHCMKNFVSSFREHHPHAYNAVVGALGASLGAGIGGATARVLAGAAIGGGITGYLSS